MKLRVGLIGLGATWESRHRPALHALADRYDVRVVCAPVAQRAEQVAREFQASVADGFRAVAARGDIDALLILSSDWHGAVPILAACDYGKAVYCATALDLEPDRALTLMHRVERSGIAFMAELPRRQAPATLRLKELLATRLGKPRLLFCHQRLPTRPEPTPRGPTCSAAPPPITREMFSLVDWCRYVVGSEPAGVTGVAHHQGNRSDYEMISMDFPLPDGSTVLAHVSCGNYFPAEWSEAMAFRPPAALQVCCDHGVAFVDLPSTLVWFDAAGRHHESLDSERPVGEQLFTHFYRAVTSLVRKTSDLEDACRALQIVLTARQSANEGRRFPLDELTVLGGLPRG